MPRTTLLIALIRTDGDTQQRISINDQVVDEYAEALAAGEVLPDIEVFKDDDGEHWLWDGYHRLAAYQRNNQSTIPANVEIGTRRDAVLASVGANANHGLRRNNQDKRNAVLTLLRDSEWKLWSDRKIAHLCGVSHPFVGKVRRAMEAGVGGNRFQFPEGCTGTKARVSFIEQQDSALSIQDLLETPDLQDEVIRVGERHLGELAELQAIDDAEKLLGKIDHFCGWGWPEDADSPGMEKAYLRRLDALASWTLIEPETADPTGLPVSAQLAIITTNEDMEVAQVLAAFKGLSPGVRRHALIAIQALEKARDNIRYGLHWIKKTQEKPWLTVGALNLLTRAAEKLEAKEAKEAAEKAWLEKALTMGVDAAIAQAGAETCKERLLAWLKGEQAKGPKQRSTGAPVRLAIRKHLAELGVSLVECPDHADTWVKTGGRCQCCYRTRAEVLEKQAREKTAAWQETQRQRTPQLSVGCWIEVRQAAARGRLKAGQRWEVGAISEHYYTLQRTEDGERIEERNEIAFINGLLGRELVTIPTPATSAPVIHIEETDLEAGEQVILPGASRPVFIVDVIGSIVLDEDGKKVSIDGAILRPTGPREDLRTMPLGERAVVIPEADYRALLAGQLGAAAK